ncbi:MAG TPA: PAS domain S-box protein [Methanobacterium sp.]
MKNKLIKILLVEDNPGDALLLDEMLKEVGNTQFQLSHATRLDEGLKYLLKDTFDLLLLDLGLPDSQGIDTFTIMNQHAPELPIIILTGLEDEKFAISAVGTGAQDYLVKGQVDSRLLVRSIKYAIERKRIEEALRKSEEKYRNIVETAQSGILLTDSKGNINYVNSRMANMLGHAVQDLLGWNLFNIVDEEGQEKVESYLKRREEGINEITEFKFIRKDGSDLWALISSNPLFNQNEQYIGALGVVTDITARKGVEKALIERQKHLNLITANMMDVVSHLALKEICDVSSHESKFS